jgi:hypothetical protein
VYYITDGGGNLKINPLLNPDVSPSRWKYRSYFGVTETFRLAAMNLRSNEG